MNPTRNISLNWSDPPIEEAASELSVASDQIRRLLRDNQLVAYRVGKHIRVLRASLDRYKAMNIMARSEFATGRSAKDRDVRAAEGGGEAA